MSSLGPVRLVMSMWRHNCWLPRWGIHLWEDEVVAFAFADFSCFIQRVFHYVGPRWSLKLVEIFTSTAGRLLFMDDENA